MIDLLKENGLVKTTKGKIFITFVMLFDQTRLYGDTYQPLMTYLTVVDGRECTSFELNLGYGFAIMYWSIWPLVYQICFIVILNFFCYA